MILWWWVGIAIYEAIKEIIAAYVYQGNHAAVLVGRFLKTHQFQTANPTLLYPKWFLIDLSHALQIQEWETQRLVEHLPTDLPKSESVFKAIDEKLRNSAGRPRSKTKADKKLAHSVTTAFLRHFCHKRENDFPGDFMLKPASRVELIESIAQWLLKHRPTNT